MGAYLHFISINFNHGHSILKHWVSLWDMVFLLYISSYTPLSYFITHKAIFLLGTLSPPNVSVINYLQWTAYILAFQWPCCHKLHTQIWTVTPQKVLVLGGFYWMFAERKESPRRRDDTIFAKRKIKYYHSLFIYKDDWSMGASINKSL